MATIILLLAGAEMGQQHPLATWQSNDGSDGRGLP
jgi:hypothetical protein